MLLTSRIPSATQLPNILFIVTLLVAGVIYLVTLDPSRFGVQYDDAIYVASAKALATNQQYRIISLPSEPAQTKFPPLYPILLSLIWRVDPVFPRNVFWMMLASVAATICLLLLTYRYLVQNEY